MFAAFERPLVSRAKHSAQVKLDLRDAERPRYRFEMHMGPLYVEAGEMHDRKVLLDFKTLQAQGAQTLRVVW